ncbi:efflux transporter outer membrane subunit [Sphingomonas sp. LaA6.9]|uniref:efflux transporter outer membrane subunit n=1 Tax=Sphingomonas sp. LaA6.9 TaxID=2919914 RepID=UPI001F4F6A30|nr:efflux transporter outer membrane subunit [Sphingomonas sp. LaA6.9]MCJ8159531.1 efflux transporter outer membrane subunit [Sphingomonas sp. LaA6.9]
MRIRPILSLSLAALTAACTVGPDYRPQPAIDLGVPDAYTRGGGEPMSAETLASWWRQFNDPALNALMDRALAENLDLAQSAARLKQARESLVQANAGRLPTVDASASAGRNFSNVTRDRSSFSIGGDAAWEIDLFGGIARGIEAARADAEGAEFDLAAVRIAIVSEIATNYVQLRLSQEQIRIARDTLTNDQENYDIARWRVQAGLVSSLDEEQARAQLARTTAAIPRLQTSFSGALNRIAVLTAQAPGAATQALEQSEPIPSAPTDIATGIPADTLRQRPDIRGAERTLAAATARIGVAEAELYPALRITGDIGTSAFSVGNLVDTVTAGLFSSLSQTIFDGGRRRSQVRSQQAAAEGALAAYRQSVLTGLEDVENALVALDSSRARAEQLAIALDAANNSAILARSQYRAGLTDFQTLLQTEQSLLVARESYAGVQADTALSIVQLYRALGGGWQTMDGMTQ